MPQRQRLIAPSGRRLPGERIKRGGAWGGRHLEADGGARGLGGRSHFPRARLDVLGGFESPEGGTVRGRRVQGEEGKNEVNGEEDADGGDPTGISERTMPCTGGGVARFRGWMLTKG
jgi:hypothetical protein